MKKLKFSILIPTYNGQDTVKETIQSVLSQSFKDYEIIVNDDMSNDKTEKIIKKFRDLRIKFYKNRKNLGYPGNLNRCLKHANGDIIYLLGQDDLLGTDALKKTYEVFANNSKIGAVTRPYRWFDEKIETTVRVKEQLNPNKNEVISITDKLDRIVAVFKTLDSLSGLAYRKKWLDRPFHSDIFPCHVYPFASIFKKHPIIFLKDFVIGVRIRSSQCRFLSSIYDKSPMKSWAEMFQTVFFETKYKKLRNYCIENFVAVNYVGLVQIKNYSTYRNLLREIAYLILYRKLNLISPGFWFFSLGTLIMPPFLLIPMVDWYKNKVNSLRFHSVKFDYQTSK